MCMSRRSFSWCFRGYRRSSHWLSHCYELPWWAGLTGRMYRKGRQLKKFDSNTYTYNANGIRTGKNVNGTAHSYRLASHSRVVVPWLQIIQPRLTVIVITPVPERINWCYSEKWGGNTLIPLYNNEDEVCGIKYNGTAYYFIKNLTNSDNHLDALSKFPFLTTFFFLFPVSSI